MRGLLALREEWDDATWDMSLRKLRNCPFAGAVASMTRFMTGGENTTNAQPLK